MEDAEKTTSDSSLIQHRLSLMLLALLVLISSVILWIQNRYDPVTWREQHASSANQPPAKTDIPQGLTPVSPSERYDKVNLSDKINGKADLYLSAGFNTLGSRRFGLTSDQTRWMERYVYEMAGHKNAFAVYSAQRRKDIQPIDVASRAYLSANGLFLVHGHYYVEIIASELSDAMQSQMKALASAFVSSHPVASHKLPELDLFGSENLVPHTTKLIADSAFGIQNLNWVYAATYAADQAEATLFISKQSSTAQARSMTETFIGNWNEYGAEAVRTPDNIKGARIVLILDTYEIAMVQGRYFFGVHEATDLDFALGLIARIRRSIVDVGDDVGEEDEK